MEQVKRLIMVPVILMILTGCQTTKTYKDYEPPKLDYKDEQPYTIDLSGLKPGDPPDFRMGRIEADGSLKLLDDPDDPTATHVVLTSAEFSKVEALVDLVAGYKKITKEQEALVNAKIAKINALQNYLNVERDLTIQYYYLWKNADQAYTKEKKEHRWDNIINKSTMVVTAIGGMVALSL